MKYEKKLFLSNLLTFIFLLISFLLLYHHLQAVNFEYSYRNYQNELNLLDNEIEKIEVSKWLITLTSINFILILNSLFYLTKSKYYMNFISYIANKVRKV